MKYTSDAFLYDSPPTVFDNYSAYANLDGCSVNLCKFRLVCFLIINFFTNFHFLKAFFDTSGEHNFEAIRPICYKETDIFFVCFSIVDFCSFRCVEKIWIPEIRQFCPTAPIVLVGTKVDLRHDNKTLENLRRESERPVKFTEVQKKFEK
jgi:small GTP-binding protein